MFGGCCRHQPYVSSERLDRGLVIVLPGIEGASQLNRDICEGLDVGGVFKAIQLYDWTSRLGPLYNLRAINRNRKQAGELANYIRRYRRICPHAPVFIIGQSGGGAIAVWTAEILGNREPVDGVILLAASLSPGYRLEKAIKGTRRGIVSYYSHRDWFLIGTNIAGTMDGQFTSSAGRIGFDQPSPLPHDYKKLIQIPWQPHMARSGHTGGHLTSGDASFIADYVAPFVNSSRWDEATTRRITGARTGKDFSEYIVLPARL